MRVRRSWRNRPRCHVHGEILRVVVSSELRLASCSWNAFLSFDLRRTGQREPESPPRLSLAVIINALGSQEASPDSLHLFGAVQKRRHTALGPVRTDPHVTLADDDLRQGRCSVFVGAGSTTDNRQGLPSDTLDSVSLQSGSGSQAARSLATSGITLASGATGRIALTSSGQRINCVTTIAPAFLRRTWGGNDSGGDAVTMQYRLLPKAARHRQTDAVMRRPDRSSSWLPLSLQPVFSPCHDLGSPLGIPYTRGAPAA